jgi:hypothetical protein
MEMYSVFLLNFECSATQEKSLVTARCRVTVQETYTTSPRHFSILRASRFMSSAVQYFLKTAYFVSDF